MDRTMLLLLLLACACCLSSAEFTLHEGDIAFSAARLHKSVTLTVSVSMYRVAQKAQQDSNAGSHKPRARHEYLRHVRLWPNATVPYVIDHRDFPDIYANLIERAIDELRAQTCVRLVPRAASDADYLQFVADSGCYSYLGRIGGGQTVSLAPGCMSKGVIQHELMHAIGFAHEHNRPDRDEHVAINWQNVLPDKTAYFERYDAEHPLPGLNMPYDYASLMHYGTYAFSRNRQPTIRPVSSQANIGQRVGFSATDVAKIKQLYRCGGRKTRPVGTEDVAVQRQQQQPACADTRADCTYLQDSGYCESLTQFMRVYCAETCGLCDQTTSSSSPAATTAAPTLATTLGGLSIRLPFIVTGRVGPTPSTSVAPSLANTGSAGGLLLIAPFCRERRPQECASMAANGFCDEAWFRVECGTACRLPQCLTQLQQQPATGTATRQAVGLALAHYQATVAPCVQLVTTTTGRPSLPDQIECEDRQPDCAEQLQLGECRDDRQRMLDQCARTCGFCLLLGQLTQPPTTAAPVSAQQVVASQLGQLLLGVAPRQAGGVCADARPDCPLFAQQRLCNLWPDFMARNCAVSCNKCQALLGVALQQQCVDRRPDCAQMVRSLYCGIAPDWSRQWCARSCRLCA